MNTLFADVTIEDMAWKSMTHSERNHQLFMKQKELLDRFLEHGAITQAQYDKSLHDLVIQTGEKI